MTPLSRSANRPRERSERPATNIASPTTQTSPSRKSQQAAPQLVISRTEQLDTINPDEFQRRRRPAATSPRNNHATAHYTPRGQGRLYNPDSDPVPMRRTAEPETISDTGSSSYAPRNTSSMAAAVTERGVHHGRLFDHRKDDPVKFHALRGAPSGNRPVPTPKSSGDYVSASSTSSYAHSITSSSFTLNSTTDGSSASSALFDGEQPREHASSSAFAQQLKKLYRGISNLESRLLREDGKDYAEEGRITLKRPNEAMAEPEEAEKEKWKKFVTDHKLYVLHLVYIRNPTLNINL